MAELNEMVGISGGSDHPDDKLPTLKTVETVHQKAHVPNYLKIVFGVFCMEHGSILVFGILFCVCKKK